MKVNFKDLKTILNSYEFVHWGSKEESIELDIEIVPTNFNNGTLVDTLVIKMETDSDGESKRAEIFDFKANENPRLMITRNIVMKIRKDDPLNGNEMSDDDGIPF